MTAERSLEANVEGRGFCRIDLAQGSIVAVRWLSSEDLLAEYCAPGFVDLQINGMAGVDFSSPDLSVDDIIRVLPALWATGCTSFCPTLITNSRENLERNFKLLERARKTVPGFAESAPCYHLEGPFLSSGASRGAHDPTLMRDPDWNELEFLQQAAGGNIGILTLAPEKRGALELIAKGRAAGIVMALSHTDGTPEDVHRAAAGGATFNTHLGNGCPGMIHRHNAAFWGQLADDSLAAGIICDGFHLPADLIRIILRVKGIARCALVTDAVHVTGLPPGRYTLVGIPIELLPSGQVVTVEGHSMAGSTLTMDRAISNVMRLAGLSLTEALHCATTTPAEVLNRPSVCARVAVGQPANLAIFSVTDGNLKIKQTLLNGQAVYTA